MVQDGKLSHAEINQSSSAGNTNDLVIKDKESVVIDDIESVSSVDESTEAPPAQNSSRSSDRNKNKKKATSPVHKEPSTPVATIVTTSATKKRKKTKDPNEPKRPLSSYMLFCVEARPDLVKKNPTLKFLEVGKMLGKQFKQLKVKDKEKYTKFAAEARERYNLEMEKYNNSDQVDV